MEPSLKSGTIAAVLNSLSTELFGRNLTDSIKGNVCVCCGKPADAFRDQLSAKEFTISGFCQTCQDDTFGGEDD